MRPIARLVALDHLRGFVVAVVVLHHTILAYCAFGSIDYRHYILSTAPIVDTQRWVGFDIMVMLNDSFFMPLMFLLSGLFVWNGLVRNGTRAFLAGRILRLGVPFIVSVLTLVPLAYYPSWLQSGGAPGFPAFWIAMVTAGPWPSGPPWFVGVLLLFDAAIALAFAALGRPGTVAKARPVPAPRRCFGVFLACLLIAYLPMLAAFGPSRWIAVGPLAIQASRIGLYAICFAAGVRFGANGLQHDKARFADSLIRQWPTWALLAALAGTTLIGTQIAQMRMGAELPHWAWLSIHGIALATFCATTCFALPAIFLRFCNERSTLWHSLAVSSYGIYLLHYPIVTWLQYALLTAPLNAATKAVVTFAAALLLSWVGTILLRRGAGASRVL